MVVKKKKELPVITNDVKNSNKGYLILLGVCLLIIVALLVLLVAASFKGSLDVIEKEYYKDQMLNFCEISKFYHEEIYPDIYPCDQWLVENIT